MTLPPGWTGNAKIHHRTVGPFRATVYYAGTGLAGRGYGWRIEYIRRNSWGGHDYMKGDKVEGTIAEWEAEQARNAAMDHLRQLANEILTDLA